MAYMKKVFNSKILVVLIFIFSALSGILFTACSGMMQKSPKTEFPNRETNGFFLLRNTSAQYPIRVWVIPQPIGIIQR